LLCHYSLVIVLLAAVLLDVYVLLPTWWLVVVGCLLHERKLYFLHMLGSYYAFASLIECKCITFIKPKQWCFSSADWYGNEKEWSSMRRWAASVWYTYCGGSSQMAQLLKNLSFYHGVRIKIWWEV
jgi:hypothetical protein